LRIHNDSVATPLHSLTAHPSKAAISFVLMSKMPFPMDSCSPPWAAASKLLALSAALVLPSIPVQAVQTAATFDVSINLHAAPQSGSCRTAESANEASIACSTGNFHFMANLKNDELSISGDGYAGTGTSTAYRLVSLVDRQYIEMTVGW
jgi:hypothetical protein